MAEEDYSAHNEIVWIHPILKSIAKHSKDVDNFDKPHVKQAETKKNAIWHR